MRCGHNQPCSTDVPSDELVEHFDVFLQLLYRCGVLCIEDGKGGRGCTVIDIGTTGLDEAADEDDFKEGICILQKLECGSGLHEFCSKGFEIVLLDCF